MLAAPTPRLFALALVTASLTGCPASGQRPAQPPQGQWAQPGQYVPPGQYGQPGQPPMGQPVQPGPGQWVPPPPQNTGPFGWWPQGGNVPIPAIGPVPI